LVESSFSPRDHRPQSHKSKTERICSERNSYSRAQEVNGFFNPRKYLNVGQPSPQISLRFEEDCTPNCSRGAASQKRKLSPMSELPQTSNNLELAAEIVSAFVSNNSRPASELPALLGSVHAALNAVAHDAGQPVAEEPKAPAVPIKKSVQPDYIVCLDDGKRFKSLKRHLRTTYNLTPEQYRAKWGLPSSYPMVAPNYAATRSELAKRLGLGQQRRRTEPVKAEPQPAASSTKGRRRKKAA
jgi:predicted transcriptional regulator